MRSMLVIMLAIIALSLFLTACATTEETLTKQQQDANTAMIKKEITKHNDDVLAIFDKHNKSGKLKGVLKSTIIVNEKGAVKKCAIVSQSGNLTAGLVSELIHYFSAVKFPTRHLLSYTWLISLE